MIDITDPRNLTSIQNCTDWRSAVDNLLDLWTTQLRCFSSGEVAACLRLHRPDLAFSVLTLGSVLKDKFYLGLLPEYPDPSNGQDQYFSGTPVQVPRMTVGRFPTRTPAGVSVFVYGPDVQAADTHDFEVFIPKLGETMADSPTPATSLSPAPSFPTTTPVAGQAKTPVLIAGAKVSGVDIMAKVWPDKRLCIPRPALEAAVHLSGTPLRGGDPVFVTLTPTSVVVTLTREDAGQKEYNISSEKGRVAFPSNDPTQPFVPGTVYRVQVDGGGKLTLDLTTGKLPTVSTI